MTEHETTAGGDPVETADRRVWRRLLPRLRLAIPAVTVLVRILFPRRVRHGSTLLIVGGRPIAAYDGRGQAR